MTIARLIPLPLHAAIELAGGAALMAAPIVFGFGPAAFVTAVFVGALTVALALTATGAEDHGTRGTVPISAHAAYDVGLAAGLVIAALALGAIGESVALAVFSVAALAQVLLSATTRYSVSHA